MMNRNFGIALLSVSLLVACAGTRPDGVGNTGPELAPCPASPNCVSSEATDEAHRIDAFALAVAPEQAWPTIREEVARLPRTAVVSESADALHAECTSALFRFVDDLELRLRSVDDVVAVRSASRVGHSDLGVNRERVEALRAALRERGVVR